MALKWLILMAPLGLVLLAGFALAVRNFYRHGRAARVALVGYLLLLLWFWSHLGMLTLMVFVPRGQPWGVVYDFFHRGSAVTSVVAQPLGLALVAWAVFIGRSAKKEAPPVEEA